MQLSIRVAFLAVVMAAASVTGAFAGGLFEDGAAANKRGDYAKAVEIWRPLAEHGNAKAQVALSVMYEMGRGVPQSASESIKWLRPAAEQGDIGAQFALGSNYAAGTGVKQDYVEAVKWLRRAAEQGDTISQLALGGTYAQGLGVQSDLVEALKWLMIAASQDLMKKQSEKNRDMVASVMTPEQIMEAKSQAAKWKAKKEIEPKPPG